MLSPGENIDKGSGSEVICAFVYFAIKKVQPWQAHITHLRALQPLHLTTVLKWLICPFVSTTPTACTQGTGPFCYSCRIPLEVPYLTVETPSRSPLSTTVSYIPDSCYSFILYRLQHFISYILSQYHWN